MIDEAAASELENFRLKYKSVVDENNTLSVKVSVQKGHHATACNLFRTEVS